jgi:hypothetical protein
LTSGFSPQRHPALRNFSQSVAGPMRDTSRAGLAERRESELPCIRTSECVRPNRGLPKGTTAGAVLWEGEGPSPEFPPDTAGPTDPGPREVHMYLVFNQRLIAPFVPARPTLSIRLQSSLCVDLRKPGSAAIVQGRCATD